MIDYSEVTFHITPISEDITDLLAAFLAEEGFDSFTSDDNGMSAFIPTKNLEIDKIKEIIDNFPISAKFSFEIKNHPGKNWNEEWEKNYFKPISINNQCTVHSSFHHDYEKSEYEIIIDPKMAFGTGHHATTSNMIRHLLDMDLKGKSVIDMGTGTGILAILAAMKGAKDVVGIDIDEDAALNADENAKLNHVNIRIMQGDVTSLETLNAADIFIANITKNIILQDLPSYVTKLKKGGILLLSGFYNEDIPEIAEKGQALGLSLQGKHEENNWVAIKLIKDIPV